MLLVAAVLAAGGAWAGRPRHREGRAFIGLGLFLVIGVATIFMAAYPNVLPSTLDAAFNLTVANASSSPTRWLMSIVAAFGVPLVLAYQGWTYWVFRKRITEPHIPEPHAVARRLAGHSSSSQEGHHRETRTSRGPRRPRMSWPCSPRWRRSRPSGWS